jgi:hypothetical protein
MIEDGKLYIGRLIIQTKDHESFYNVSNELLSKIEQALDTQLLR